eukprot:TRINITY_DN24855_c0_g1_i1.p1 TRINITY_DN24855_c0_g1~~TRINITY_DN24855_c0_g1_i1.p1  ORF type:complete len:327 (+),score=88.15 TRINITY_DN24855_c0_g1_i1:185-1165(+)
MAHHDKKARTGSSLRGKHVLSTRDLSREEVDMLCDSAHQMMTQVKSGVALELAKGRVLAELFFEPSTRTMCSFEAAMLRLGGQVIRLNDMANTSTKKGETLTDTVATLLSYCDACVIRHPEKGAVQRAADSASKPVINAGDGVGEHPTQALLDLFTIRQELSGRDLDKDTVLITLVGDLKHGRTVHSLVKVLALHQGIRLHCVAPAALKMPAEIINALREQHPSIQIQESESLSTELVGESDVIYVTRVQKERFSSVEEYTQVQGSYTIDNALMASAKKDMIVMHPLPRVGEIKEEFDQDPRAAYFRQMEYGMYMRMAILDAVMLS